MKLKSLTARSFLMAALVALPVATFAASTPVASDRDDSQSLELMKNLAFTANDAADQASELDAAAYSSSVTWEVHAQRLQALKDDVNEMGRILTRLDDRRASLSAPDRDSLDRAGTILKDMATNSQAAIQFLNADQQNFWQSSYRKNVSNLSNESTQLASSLDHAIALDKARMKDKR
jgi:hypothetical protein